MFIAEGILRRVWRGSEYREWVGALFFRWLAKNINKLLPYCIVELYE